MISRAVGIGVAAADFPALAAGSPSSSDNIVTFFVWEDDLTMEDLTRDEINELIKCALNKTGAIRPSSRARLDAAALLVGKGLMAAKPSDVYNLNVHPSIKPTLRRNAQMWLTDAGKAAILALSPEDFKNNMWWPLPRDIEYAQSRVRGD